MNLSLDIATLTSAYASGTLTPAEVIREVYERIRARGERPVWITLFDEDAVLAKANEAPRGPLYGIPFAVKDNIDVAGQPTTCACPEFAYVAKRSAMVVERLESAGAILIGKTNMDQFATGLVGTRSPYGIPASVFSDDHISGGSSSGSAVAVAAGLVSFALGTDTAGSGRVPAAFNNIVGLKPTKGLVSTRGVVPACRTQDVVSIFAATVGDAHTALGVAAGFDAEDSYCRPAPRSIAPEALPGGFLFGVPADGLDFLGDAQAALCFEAAAARLTALGGRRVAIDFAPFREAASLLYAGPWVAERLAAIDDFARANPQAMDPVVRGIICSADKIDAVSAFKAFYRLSELVRAAEAEWAKMDVLLVPTAGTIYRIDEVVADPVRLNSNLGLTTNFVNLMDLSALAVPAGFRADGLPCGVTLIARAFEDGKLAVLGDKLHRAMSGATMGNSGTPLPEGSIVTARPNPDLLSRRGRRRASFRPAAQQPARGAGRAARRNDAHRARLQLLRPAGHGASEAGSRLRRRRQGWHRGRGVGDGCGRVRLVRRPHSAAARHRHADACRRGHGQRIHMRRPRRARGRGHHRIRWLARLARPRDRVITERQPGLLSH